MIMEDDVLDTKSEVLYYDMDTDVVTVFCINNEKWMDYWCSYKGGQRNEYH